MNRFHLPGPSAVGRCISLNQFSSFQVFLFSFPFLSFLLYFPLYFFFIFHFLSQFYWSTEYNNSLILIVLKFWQTCVPVLPTSSSRNRTFCHPEKFLFVHATWQSVPAPPSATGNCWSFLGHGNLALPVLGFRLNGLTQCVLFSVWLLSLSMMFLRSTQVVCVSLLL